MRCPVEYHNENSGGRPWRRALALCLPTVAACALFAAPIMFEVDVVTKARSESSDDGDDGSAGGSGGDGNSTVSHMTRMCEGR